MPFRSVDDRLVRADRLATTIQHELGRLNMVARTKDGDVQRIHFDYPLLCTPDELWLPIDLQRLPLGIPSSRLRDDALLISLSDRCGSTVRLDTLPNNKIAFVVRLGGSTFPAVFSINSFDLPSDAPLLAFPLGLDGRGDQRWLDLARLPHLLGVGSTGKGKSVFVHNLVCTLISRNTADDIELWLADHKGGTELGRYKSLMGAKGRAGIVRRFSYEPETTIELLDQAFKEMQRRQTLLREADCADLDDYAQQTGQYLRRIVIVIDEIYHLMLNPTQLDPMPGAKGKTKATTIAKWAELLLSKIASLGRALGVHLCIFTQRSGKEVLTNLITANFESRVVFSQADMYQSIYVLGRDVARGLPKGRAVFRADDGELEMVQTPLITQSQIRLLVARIERFGPAGGLGDADASRRFLQDAKLLLQISCDHLGGSFGRAAMLRCEGVGGVFTRERFEEIAKRLERDGILVSGGPRRPRRIAPGFMNRVELLDTIYGRQLDGSSADNAPAIAPIAAPGGADENTDEAHQDAINEQAALLPDTAHSTQQEPGDSSTETDDLPLPDFINRAFDKRKDK